MPKLIVNERPFEVGDEVFEFAYGIGRVCEIHDRDEYSIVIDFAKFKELRFFKHDGIGGEDGRRCLFHLDVAQELGFVDMKINVTEPFKPEVGQLYYRPESNEVLEYVKDNQYYLDSGISVDYLPRHMINAEKIQEFDKYPTADNVWFNHNGNAHEWDITDFGRMGDIETITITDSCQELTIDYDGKAFGLPLKFYRNKHRAERFGCKNA